MIKHRLHTQLETNMCLDSNMRDNRRRTLSLEEELLWIMDSYFVQKQGLKLKTSWCICFLQTQILTIVYIVHYCDVFISCLDIYI